MARVKRDKRYQLPKNRIAVPLIFFTLVFIIACALVSLSGDLIATYVTKLKALNEVENTARYAGIYNVAEEGELDKLFESFGDSGYTVFVSDNNMNILKSNGEITAVLEMDENDDDDDDKEVCEKCGKPLDECECEDEDKKDKYVLEEIPEYMELSQNYSALQADYSTLNEQVATLTATNATLEE